MDNGNSQKQMEAAGGDIFDPRAKLGFVFLNTHYELICSHTFL